MNLKWFNSFLTCSLLGFLTFNSAKAQTITSYTISGFVKEVSTKELLLGVYIYTADGKYGTVSNNYGFYSLSLPQGKYELKYAYIGYVDEVRSVNLTMDTRLDVSLNPDAEIMKEAVVTGKREQRESEKVQMSTIDIPIKQIKDIPALFGEKDVLKTIQLMPGVQSGSEGQSGLYVRGGGPDQNLIILDGATVYNAQHLFGFFSLFNGDALRSVELVKGGFPARYGGRLSSVVDMNMKDGSKDHITGELGIGIISSKGLIEGPFAKGKGSFIVSGRRTYIDALIQPFVLKQNGGPAGYYFYDLNAKVNYELGDNDRVYLSGYFGRDRFYLTEKYSNGTEVQKTKAGFGWGNATATARWNHVFGPKLFLNTAVIYSQYQLEIKGSEETNGKPDFEIQYGSGIRDWSIKQDYDWYFKPAHKIRFGFSFTDHLFTPDALAVRDNYVDETINRKTEYKTVETGLYIEDEFKLLNRLSGIVGIRMSSFHVRGSDYFRPEPRLSLAYNVKSDLSLKASYATMNQYIHLLSNSGVGLPTDLWVPSTDRVSPSQSSQIAIGAAKDFLKKNFSVTLEGYYKTMSNIIGYKEGASFLSIQEFDGNGNKITWEDNITAGKGVSYGSELLVQRKSGRLTGWVGYTLSWTTQQFDALNNGKKFYAKYDRRHDISVVGIYELKENITLSGTFVYGTGNAITLPITTYQLQLPQTYGSTFGYWTNGTEYTGRNAYRMRAYQRADIGLQFEKKKKRGIRTFEFSVYNVYNQKNPFYYYIGSENRWDSNSKKVLRQISLFPVLPSVSWNYKFK